MKIFFDRMNRIDRILLGEMKLFYRRFSQIGADYLGCVLGLRAWVVAGGTPTLLSCWACVLGYLLTTNY